MVALAANAARFHTFNGKTFRLSLVEIYRCSYDHGATVNQALEAGWKLSVDHAMADGIISQHEETRLRLFRDQLALDPNTADFHAIAQLDQATTDRLMLDARLAALAIDDAETHLHDLSTAIRQAGMTPAEGKRPPHPSLGSRRGRRPRRRILTLNEENALNRYMDHFKLNRYQLDRNGVLTQVVKSAVLRDIADGVAPQRQTTTGHVPFNLMKSGKLVWVMQDVDYYETKTRREHRGTSHVLSIRIARGIYYRPGSFRSQAVEWGRDRPRPHRTPGLHHQAPSGPKKKLQVRYNRIVDSNLSPTG